jgi:hypothetical protein
MGQVDVKQGVASITKTWKEKGGIVSETSEQEVVSEKGYVEPTANVGFSAKATRNLGNFESMQVSVSLHMPCYVGEIDAVFDFAKEWVDAKMGEILEPLDGKSSD